MRQRIPLAIGRGLDRATGLVASSPGAPVDARNVYARDGKMAVTPGMSLTGFPDLDWGTDIVCTFGMQSNLDLMLVVYDSVSRDLRLYRIDTINSTTALVLGPAAVEKWGTLAGGVEFPVITAAEAEGKAGFAHAELSIDSRLVTIVYTPDPDGVSPGAWAPLMADLDGEGSAEVFFYAIIAHLLYICGVGFGSATDPARGDVLRLSNPDAPWTFLSENYALVGVQGDPVVGMVPVTGSLSAFGGIQSVLALGKANRSYRLIGSSFDDFQVEELDPKHGVVSAVCAGNVGGPAYWWSDDGPRVVTPAGTEPISQPLELISPLPADFPSRGPARLCFFHFDKTRYLVEWYWPNPTEASVPVPGFALSIWDPKNPRWSFRERMQPVVCGGYLITRDAGTPPAPPAGYVSGILATDVGVAGDARYRRVALTWDNNAAAGSETVQLFARALGGDWYLAMAVAVSGSSQSAEWVTALPVTFYDLAMRYVNVHTPGVGYEGTDPDAWTAPTAPSAKATVTTGSESVGWGS